MAEPTSDSNMVLRKFAAVFTKTQTHRARALLPATRHRSSGPLGALLSSPALDVRLPTALQVLQDNPREGWEDGTPLPHRDFKRRGVVR